MNDPTIISELERIREQHGGLLRASDVVEAARPPESVLHGQFLWDDSKAAENFRLQQARQLIRVTVQWIGQDGDARKSRVFVSLSPDRTPNGGYRPMVSVLSSEDMRQQMLADALEEMRRFQNRYRELNELVGVFDAMTKVIDVKAA